MRTKNTPIQITVPNYREPISGIVNTAMSKMDIVQVKADSPAIAGGQRELVAADGTGVPAFLERDVLSLADWQTYCKQNPLYNTDILHPVPVGSSVSARFAHEVEVEGTDHLDSITAGSTAGAALTLAAGKFAVAGEGDRIFGHLGRLVVPHVTNAVRWAIDMLG